MKTKEEKPVKVPGSLKKPMKKKVFNRRYLKYIEHPGERNFFIACFNFKDDIYTIRDNLKKEDVKKIKLILKSIKGNKKGPVKIVPLVFAGALAAAIFIFFTTFANPLLGRATELGLEAIFEAKADVSNFRLSLHQFTISVDSVTVANRDKPMQNLFEMGKTEIRMTPAAVLRGKINIEEIRADTIRFGTPRTVSGAIPTRPPREKREKPPKEDTPPLFDLANFDVMGLLNSEFDKLNTPKLYDEAIELYNQTLTKWQGEVDATRARADELRNAAQPLINLNVANIRDVDAVRRTIQDITTMVNTVQTAANHAANLVSGIEDDINNAMQLENNARNALTNDIDHLKSYVDLSSGAALAALDPFIREILSDTAEEYIEYGMMALEVLERLKAQAESRPKTEPRPKKEKRVAFQGRDVIFPVDSYPTFYLGILASDFTLDTWKWDFDLRNISSEPDHRYRGGPVTLSLGLSEVDTRLQRRVAFNGSADFRSNPSQRFNAVLSGGGFPLSLGDQLSSVGINGFTGQTDFSVNLSGYPDGGVSAGGDVFINSARLVDPRGILATAVDEAVREANRIDLGVQYTYRVGARDVFNITTNITDLIAQALLRTAQAYAQRAMDEIERVLRERIEQYIDGRFVSRDDVDALLRLARGDKAAMDQLMGSLTNKRNEFEQRLRTMATEAINQVREEVTEAIDQVREDATRQAEQAVRDVMQGNQPTIQPPQTPSLPSLPSTGGGGLRLPGGR